MVFPVEVLVEIDDVNKIYYTEVKNFAANDNEGINNALNELKELLSTALAKGYQIIKREKNITPMDDGMMATIDEKINELGGPSR